MKHFIIKTVCMLVCILFGFSGTAKGQIYSSETLFYIKAGTSLMSDPSMELVHIDSETNTVFINSISHGLTAVEKNGFERYDDDSYVRDCIRKGVTVFQCNYNSSLSKNGKEVYEYYSFGSLTSFFVFSSDLSSYERISKDGKYRTTYIRVSRDKFKTKDDSNYDFLYD